MYIDLEWRNQTFFFGAHAMIFYIENPKKRANKKHLQLISDDSNINSYNINIQKLIDSLYRKMKNYNSILKTHSIKKSNT